MQISFRFLIDSADKTPKKKSNIQSKTIEEQEQEEELPLITLLAYIILIALLLLIMVAIKVLFKLPFVYVLAFMGLLIFAIFNAKTKTISAPLPQKKPTSNMFFYNMGFKVYFPKSKPQNFFAYTEVQNLVFCFKDASSQHFPKPYMMSWEAVSPKKKKREQYQCFFDDTEKYVEADFVTLFQYFYEKNIPFLEVSEEGEKLRMLRLPAQEKPPKEQEIAAKYQKLIDEIGKKEDE
jgi:hypothetical protein